MNRQIAPPDPALRLEPTAVATLDPPPAPPRELPAVVDGALWPPPIPTFTFLAGAAGSGKTFATKEWAEEDPGLLLCATTGIAAINLGGETVNSVLGYFDTASLQEQYVSGFLTARLGKLWKSGVRRLVLDEVSMLAGEQLGFLVKAVEEVNGRGYVLSTKKKKDDGDSPPPSLGLTLVGDFLQLSPVKATYAFEAPEWDRFRPHTRTLTEIHRQADPEFIGMLRMARAGRGDIVSAYFQDRGAIHQETDDHFDGPTILAKNESVDRYNELRMSRLSGSSITFGSTRSGRQRSEWGNPDKPPSTWGIPETLQLREGALVMVLANRRVGVIPGTPGSGYLVYVNGDLGELLGAGEETLYYTPQGRKVSARVAYVQLQRTGEIVHIHPVHRQVKLPCDSARRTELRKRGQADLIEAKWEIAGAITYMPLRVAYASTVHKSQGLSLDRVQVNVRDAFFKSPGMMYVALSRARSAEGLRLVGSPQALVDRCVTDSRLREWL
jgi:ATP-dependent DNA helicase PIF1